MNTPRVAVVGGGLAGLAAALALADRGVRVTLVEGRPRLGGATYSFRREGMWIDNGQHVFLRCCTAYRSFLARLGVEEDVVLQKRLAIPVVAPGGRTSWLRRNGLPAPLHLGGALARYGFLSAADRARAVRASLALRSLDPSDHALDSISFGDWLSRHGQSARAVDALWGLICVPTINLSVSEASLQMAAKVFKTGLLSERGAADVGYARVPLQSLHGEAATRVLRAAGVDIRLSSPVASIEPLIDGTFAVTGGGWRLEADGVVVAVPHDDAARLLPRDAVPARERLKLLGWSPILNAHVVYDRPVMSLPFIAGINTSVQWVFDRTAPSGLADGQYLAVSLSAADDYIERTTADLRSEFLPALEDLLPRARGARVTDFFVTRERRATFRASPGSRSLRPGPRTHLPGLALAGAWTDTGWPATMEGAVRSGFVAAREALIALGRTRDLPSEEAA